MNADAYITIPDGISGRDVTVPVADSGAGQFAARLKKVAKERRKWARREGIACYRVYDADLPDFAASIDLYCGAGRNDGERFVVINEYRAPSSVDPEKAAARLRDMVAIAPVVLGAPAEQVFVKTRQHAKGGSQYTQEQKRSVPAQTSEGGMVVNVDFGGYLDTGIFLDHRTTRMKMGAMARGKRFLNLFSYTGTATLHAAQQGALSTTTVDLSNTYLTWARKNMLDNGFDGEQHRYVRADVIAWIQMQGRMRGADLYDVIFCDPPTFSNSKAMGNTTWSVQRDHARLIVQTAKLLAPGGVLMFSCNLRDFKIDESMLNAWGLAVEDITAETIPHDFERNPKIHKAYLIRRSEQ